MDFDAIRDRLDHPSRTVVDPGALALAGSGASAWASADGPYDRPSDDPASRAFVTRMIDRMTIPCGLRCAWVACAMALPVFEGGNPDDDRPRFVLQAIGRKLQGMVMSGAEIARLRGQARAAWLAADDSLPALRARNAARSVEFISESLPVGTARPVSQRLSLERAVELAAISFLPASHSSPRGPERTRFLRRWWRRCQAVLPITDVATALPVWHTPFELPPHPSVYADPD